jgi:anti-anti-sigma factor
MAATHRQRPDIETLFMSILEIRHERDTAAGVEIVAPEGEIDISNVEVLDQALEQAVNRRLRCLVVDLGGITYLDSAGISSLLRAGQRAADQGGMMVLVGGTPFVRRLVRMTGIDRLFAHVDTIAAALERDCAAPDDPDHSLDHEECVALAPQG